MKSIAKALVLLILVSSCQEQQKIAFIDNGEVINNYQMKLDIESKYKGKDEGFKKRTDSISKAFQLEAQEFQIKAKSMSQKKAQEKYQELGQKQQLLQQQMQFEQQQITQAFQAEIDSTIIKVKDFVKDYGAKNGYDFILGTSESAPSVLYGKDQSDLTKIITEAINADYKNK